MFHGEAPCFVSLTDLNVPISDFQIWMVSKPILSCFPCFGHCKIKFITPLLTGSNHAIPWTSPRGFHSHGGTPLSLDAYGWPIGSMYAIYGNIYHQYTPNVSIYTIHGSYGYTEIMLLVLKPRKSVIKLRKQSRFGWYKRANFMDNFKKPILEVVGVVIKIWGINM